MVCPGLIFQNLGYGGGVGSCSRRVSFVASIIEQWSTDFFTKVTGTEFELHGKYPGEPMGKLFLGTFGTGPLWTILHLRILDGESPDGRSSNLILEYSLTGMNNLKGVISARDYPSYHMTTEFNLNFEETVIWMLLGHHFMTCWYTCRRITRHRTLIGSWRILWFDRSLQPEWTNFYPYPSLAWKKWSLNIGNVILYSV